MVNYFSKITLRDQLVGVAPALVVLVTSLLVFANGGPTGAQPRDSVFDMYMRLIPRAEESSDLDRYVIIDIDRQSLERVAPWPWPRTALGNLVTAASEAGAKSVVLTVPVGGQDPLSPEAIGQYWFAPGFADKSNTGLSTLSEAVRALPSTDVSLARALTRIPTAVTSSPFSIPVKLGAVPASKVQGVIDLSSPTKQIALYGTKQSEEISTIIKANAQQSVPIIIQDKDGIVRRAPLLFSERGDILPSAGLAPLMPALGAPASNLALDAAASIKLAQGSPIRAIRSEDTALALDPGGSLIFYPTANRNIETIPAWRILGGSEIWTGLLKDRIVYINHSPSDAGQVQTAFGALSLSAFHALISDQLLSGISLKREFWMPAAEALISLFSGLIVIALFLLKKSRSGLAVAAGLSVVTFGASWALFSSQNLLVDPTAPVMVMGFGLLALLLSQIGFLYLDGDKVRLHFHGAFPTATLSTLQRDRSANLLKGHSHQVTVLSAALTFPDAQKALIPQRPDAYVKFMAQANNAMRQSIQSSGGVVDHAESGAILGYWNTPTQSDDHIGRACSCALQLIEDIAAITSDVETAQFARISRGQKADARFEVEQARLEIGIVSAPAIAGPVGVAPFNRYAVIGDSIAYARILRQRSRLYGPAIICDESIYRELRHHLAFLDLDTINLAGSPAPRTLYGLVGNPFLKASRGFREISELQQSLTDSWRNRQSKAATESLEKLKKFPTTHRAFIELYDYRLAKLKGKASTELQKRFYWDTEQPIEL